jgi:endoglucanase
MARIKAQGFTYVRLPIATNVLFQANNPSQLTAINLAYVDNAVKIIIDAGLAVVFDGIHNSDEAFEKNLATSAGYDEKAIAYWKALAQYFSKYPTDKMYFEVYNEPHVGTSKFNNLNVT